MRFLNYLLNLLNIRLLNGPKRFNTIEHYNYENEYEDIEHHYDTSRYAFNDGYKNLTKLLDIEEIGDYRENYRTPLIDCFTYVTSMRNKKFCEINNYCGQGVYHVNETFMKFLNYGLCYGYGNHKIQCYEIDNEKYCKYNNMFMTKVYRIIRTAETIDGNYIDDLRNINNLLIVNINKKWVIKSKQCVMMSTFVNIKFIREPNDNYGKYFKLEHHGDKTFSYLKYTKDAYKAICGYNKYYNTLTEAINNLPVTLIATIKTYAGTVDELIKETYANDTLKDCEYIFELNGNSYKGINKFNTRLTDCATYRGNILRLQQKQYIDLTTVYDGGLLKYINKLSSQLIMCFLDILNIIIDYLLDKLRNIIRNLWHLLPIISDLVDDIFILLKMIMEKLFSSIKLSVQWLLDEIEKLLLETNRSYKLIEMTVLSVTVYVYTKNFILVVLVATIVVTITGLSRY